jgi:hypothetical protein
MSNRPSLVVRNSFQDEKQLRYGNCDPVTNLLENGLDFRSNSSEFVSKLNDVWGGNEESGLRSAIYCSFIKPETFGGIKKDKNLRGSSLNNVESLDKASTQMGNEEPG